MISYGSKHCHQCSVCLKKFTRSNDLKRHTTTHTGEKPFKCNFCQKIFSRSSDLKRHNTTYTQEKPLDCKFCQTRFIRSCQLILHLKVHTVEKRFECSICRKKFTAKFHLTRHRLTHTGEKPFECSVCFKKFNRSDKLQQHIGTHKGDKYDWQNLQKKFETLCELTRQAQTHNAKKPCNCSLCVEVFRTLAALRLDGLQSHRCVLCNKGFTRQYHLTRHIRCHIGEKPFFCNMCGKEFQTNLYRNLHKQKCPDHNGSRNLRETGSPEIFSSFADSSSTCSEDFSQREPNNKSKNTSQDSDSTSAKVLEFLKNGFGILVIATGDSSLTCKMLSENIPGITIYSKLNDFFNASQPNKALACTENFDCIVMVAFRMMNKRHVLVVNATEETITDKLNRFFGISCQVGKNIQVISDSDTIKLYD